MIVTRCPHCETGFRVTPEQIKARDGRVRCGECQRVFDALENLITAQGVAAAPAETEPLPPDHAAVIAFAAPAAEPVIAPADASAEPAPQPAGDPAAADRAAAAPPDTIAGEGVPPAAPAYIPEFLMRPIRDAGARVEPTVAAMEQVVAPPPTPAADASGVSATVPDPTEFATPPPTAPDAADPVVSPAVAAEPAADATPARPAAADNPFDDASERARASGLSAIREAREQPGYSKWAEGALTSSGSAFAEPPKRLRWPFALVAVLFAAALGGQAAIHYRSQLASRWPASAPALALLCEAAGCRVGLPRQSEFIGIEASELHADPERGDLLVLQATLRNRASFAQELPALELALTDLRDQPIVRKVLPPADYAPAAHRAGGGLAAGADLPIKVWLDGKSIGAAGYRLYVFYP